MPIMFVYQVLFTLHLLHLSISTFFANIKRSLRPSKSSSIASKSSSQPPAQQKWADTPLPLISDTHAYKLPSGVALDHACTRWARDMAFIHNTILRAFNSSYNQCLNVVPGTQEAADFLFFNQTLFRMLDHHHKVEEDFLFPDIEELIGKPGAMEANVEQHHAFEKGLECFEEYLTETTSANFDGQKFRDILDSFVFVLAEHLHDEIPTLMSLHYLDSAKMDKIWARSAHEAKKHGEIARDMPFLLSCQDNTFLLDGKASLSFPGLPFFLPYLVKAVFANKHQGAWRFSPSGMLGWPKPLDFTVS